MAKFTVISGRHMDEKGNVYSPGDEIESKKDLIGMFGSKFAKAESKPAPAKKKAKKAVSTEEAPKEPVEDTPADSAEDDPKRTS